MSAIKNPAGSFYLDDEDFKIEHQQTPTGKRLVLSLKDASFEIPDLSDKYISTNLKGQPNGVAELDEGGKLMANQLPSGIDKAEEYPTKQDFPETGQANIVYVDLATNLEYRWSGSTYVQVPTGLALGNTAETAFRGDHGNELYLATVNGKLLKSSPVLNAEDVGAASTEEVNKPIHTTMAVEITDDGFGGYDAYYGLNPINDEKINAHRNADGGIIFGISGYMSDGSFINVFSDNIAVVTEFSLNGETFSFPHQSGGIFVSSDVTLGFPATVVIESNQDNILVMDSTGVVAYNGTEYVAKIPGEFYPSSGIYIMPKTKGVIATITFIV